MPKPRRHYGRIPADWQQQFVSSYASAHAWEDRNLHTICTWPTHWKPRLPADSSSPPSPRRPSLKAEAPRSIRAPFDRMIDDWFPLTYVLNNLNRGLGLPDGYPFVLSAPVIEKLRFVHETINRA